MDGLEFMDTSQNTIALGFRKQNLYKTLLSDNQNQNMQWHQVLERKKQTPM